MLPGYDPHVVSTLHHRRSIRLRHYDYSLPVAYFVTICTHGRRCLFGEVLDGAMVLNELGLLVRDCWLATPTARIETTLDEFVVMPNHLHGIIQIGEMAESQAQGSMSEGGPAGRKFVSPSGGLGAIVRGFKGVATSRAVNSGLSPRASLWQRGYYEHVIRSERALAQVRDYVRFNPAKWEADRDNPRTWSPRPR